MATSDRKRAANRANAQRSTGPRTDAGKRKVARNALVHGFTARGALLAGDDVRDYQRFTGRMLRDLRPDGAMQEQLAEDIINYSWRLRRVPRAERLLFDKYHRAFNPDPIMDPMVEDYLLELEIEEEKEEGPLPGDDIVGYDDVVTDQTPSGLLSKMVEERDSKRNEPASPVWRLDRYVIRLERARASALRLLLALQRRDADGDVEEDDDEDDDELDCAPAASLEGPPAEVVAPAGPPLAVSQTEAPASQTETRNESAHRSAKPQAVVEAAPTDPGAVEVAEENSDPQNKPNEASIEGSAEAVASNGDALNESSQSVFPESGTKPNSEPVPDTPPPVEPNPRIGESPPPTT